MSGALDAFRAQREAAEEVHARLKEVARLLEGLRVQVDAIALDRNLRTVLRDEQDWLREARQFVAEVRYLREKERVRFWPAVCRRWALALVFALASAACAGATYAWWTEPYAAQLTEFRRRSEQIEADRRPATVPDERPRGEKLRREGPNR